MIRWTDLRVREVFAIERWEKIMKCTSPGLEKWNRAWRNFLSSREEKPFCLSVLVVVVILYFIVGQIVGTESVEDVWTKHVDPMVGFTTLMIAIFIFLHESAISYNDKLPKKLNVTFEFQGVQIMACVGASLVGEADIRALAQQIGKQMCGGEYLEFKPGFELSPPEIRESKKIYSAKFHLLDIPNRIAWHIDCDQDGNTRGILVLDINKECASGKASIKRTTGVSSDILDELKALDRPYLLWEAEEFRDNWATRKSVNIFEGKCR